MNKNNEEKSRIASLLKRFDGKTRDVLLLGALGLLLIFTAWQVFHTEDTDEVAAVYLTETETKVLRLLNEIDGVGDASVIVYEKEGDVESVVVVCEGANNLRVVMNVREAVATALGTEQKLVKIYLKKE